MFNAFVLIQVILVSYSKYELRSSNSDTPPPSTNIPTQMFRGCAVLKDLGCAHRNLYNSHSIFLVASLISFNVHLIGLRTFEQAYRYLGGRLISPAIPYDLCKLSPSEAKKSGHESRGRRWYMSLSSSTHQKKTIY